MKRIISILISSLIAIGCFAQAQVTIVSKKDKVADFPAKTLKVVLPGDNFIGMSLREAVKNSWTLSPYEFCDNEEFGGLMGNDSYYFMVVIRSSAKSDTGISFLTIVKGGEKKMEDMLELVTLPLCPSDLAGGRADIFMSAILDVAQSYIEKSLTDGFKKLKLMVGRMPGSYKLVMGEDDISSHLDEKNRDAVLRSEEEIVSIMDEGAAGYAVGYAIYPTIPHQGGSCWKMVFDSRSHELYYLRKSKIGSNLDCGFTRRDLKLVKK